MVAKRIENRLTFNSSIGSAWIRRTISSSKLLCEWVSSMRVILLWESLDLSVSDVIIRSGVCAM